MLLIRQKINYSIYMKIKYLGTAAAEGIPALFCECEVCKQARLNGKKDFRSRTQVLINDDLLVDYPPDSFYHFRINKIDFSKIHNLLISHVHEDHFYPLDFEYFLDGFSHPKKCLPFTIHGSVDIENSLHVFLLNKRNQGLKANLLEPFKTYKISHYKVTPLKARHGTEHPFIYIIKDGISSMLYCHDSGLLPDETIDYLKKAKPIFDLISLDCTEGDKEILYDAHMNLDKNIETVNLFRKLGLLKNDTKIVLSHFSHNGGHVLYAEMSKIAKKLGYIVSFDGMEIKI